MKELVKQYMTDSSESMLQEAKRQIEASREYFAQVYMEEQENDLLVREAQAVYDYVNSLPESVKKVISERGKEFKQYLTNKISPKSPIFIHKSQGAIWGKNNLTINRKRKIC